MIRITDTPKPKDRFGSIPIREGKPTHNFPPGPYLPRRQKKSFLWTWLKRIVGLLLGLTLLLGVGSFLLIPYLTTTHLAKHLAAALNRPVTIARAEINPLTSTLILRQLIVGPNLSNPDDPVDPLLSAGKIVIALDPKRLLGGELVCNLEAEHFFLHLVRDKEGGYNLGMALDDLLPAVPVIPLPFSWDTIALRDSRLVFDDGQTGTTHLAEELALTISPGQAAPLRLQAKINGTPVTLPEAATPPVDSAQKAGPADQDGEGSAPPATPYDAAAKTAATTAMIQELTRAAGQYLQLPVNPPAQSRPIPPLAP